jgi:RHS repeat-associated protein
MIMPQRSMSSGSYRYGFNGKENDNEVKGSGNQQDYGDRAYDPRIGRWLSIDKLPKVDLTPYQFAVNNPIIFIDNDGKDEYLFHSNGTWSVTRSKGPDVFKKQDTEKGAYKLLNSTLPTNFNLSMVGKLEDLNFISQYSLDNSSFNNDINKNQGEGTTLDAHNELAAYAWGYAIVSGYDKATDLLSMGTKAVAKKAAIKSGDELIDAAEKATKALQKAFTASKTDKTSRIYKLYKVLDKKTGELRKWGHTTMEKLKDRYKGTKYLEDKDIIEVDRGSGDKILPKERHNIKTNPGPDNKETWRGKGG